MYFVDVGLTLNYSSNCSEPLVGHAELATHITGHSLTSSKDWKVKYWHCAENGVRPASTEKLYIKLILF